MTEQPTQGGQETELAPIKSAGTLDYLDSAMMNKAYKTATVLSKSDLLPESYKNRPDNILIAMDLASRMGTSLSLVTQNLYIVKGNPAWSGQFCAAAINGCGKFTPVKYVFTDEAGGGCRVQVTRRSDGEVLAGPTVTMQMAVDENWIKNPKWKTMPQLMLMYRAASFFARTYCPEVLMGIQTADEITDVRGEEPARETVVLTMESAE